MILNKPWGLMLSSQKDIDEFVEKITDKFPEIADRNRDIKALILKYIRDKIHET